MRKPMKLLFISVGTILLAIAVLRAIKHSVASNRPRIEATYLGKEPHDKRTVVVFVHGLFGSASDTWKNGQVSFPQLLAEDPTFKDKLDVFLFEYYSPMFSDAGGIVPLASQLKGALEDHDVLKHQNVIFMAHSMGGLIVREYLLLSPATYVGKTTLLVFYASPTNGSELTEVAKKISSNPQVGAMIPIDHNDLLQLIREEWSGREDLKRIPSRCAYELMPTEGVIVVSYSSATALCPDQSIALTANHVDIVKPQDRSDPRYSRFATALKEAISSTVAPQPNPTFRPSISQLPHQAPADLIKPPSGSYEYLYTDGNLECKTIYMKQEDGSWVEESISSPPCSTGAGFIYIEEAASAGSKWVQLNDIVFHKFVRLPRQSSGNAETAQKINGPWRVLRQVKYNP